MSMHKGLIGKSDGGGSADLTLGDYIARKQRAAAFDEVAKETKLTFEEYWTLWNNGDSTVQVISAFGGHFTKGQAELIWKAAQENK